MLDAATKLGRKIKQTAPKASAPKTLLGQATMYGGVGVVSGTTNNAINQGLLQRNNKKQQQAYTRGKTYGRHVAQQK